MNTQTTLSISEARKRIFDIADEVQKPSVYYTLTEKGRPKVVIMSADEYDSLRETMEIMEDPKILAKIKKAEEELARGEYVTWEKAKTLLGWNKGGASMVCDAPRAKGKTKKGKK